MFPFFMGGVGGYREIIFLAHSAHEYALWLKHSRDSLLSATGKRRAGWGLYMEGRSSLCVTCSAEVSVCFRQ